MNDPPIDVCIGLGFRAAPVQLKRVFSEVLPVLPSDIACSRLNVCPPRFLSTPTADGCEVVEER